MRGTYASSTYYPHMCPQRHKVSCRWSCEQTNPTVSCLFGKPWGNQGAYQRDATNMTPFPFHWIFNHRRSLRLLGHSWRIGGFFRWVTEHDIMLLTSIGIQSICILNLVHLACNELLIGAPSLLTWWFRMTGKFKVSVSLWIFCCCTFLSDPSPIIGNACH